MSHYVYVDVPDEFEIDWSILPAEYRDKVGAADYLMTLKIGYPAEFIRNNLAKLSDGDLYKVSFDNEEDELFFILKSQFKLVNKQVVDDFLADYEQRRKKSETYYRNPRR